MANRPKSRLARPVAPKKAKRGKLPAPPAAVHPIPAGTGRQAAIERAKLEWESTADALAALVCLLSSDGHVVRANRVVEDWSLGTVSSVLGVNAHSLLHPGCKSKHCEVAAFFEMSLAQIRRGKSRQFELQQVINLRFLQLTIRPMRRRSGTAAARGDPGTRAPPQR